MIRHTRSRIVGSAFFHETRGRGRAMPIFALSHQIHNVHQLSLRTLVLNFNVYR